jgi:hypothetical protein
VIEVDRVEPSDVDFVIRAEGLSGRILKRAGDVEGELRRHAAAFVNAQVQSPEARRYTRIELTPLIERVWESL